MQKCLIFYLFEWCIYYYYFQMGCTFDSFLAPPPSPSFCKRRRQREEKRREIKLSEEFFLSLFYKLIFIFILLLIAVILPGASYAPPQGQLPFMLTCSPWSTGSYCAAIWWSRALCCDTPSQFGAEAPCHVAVTQCLVPSGATGSQFSSMNLLMLKPLLRSVENVMDCAYYFWKD